LYKKTRPLLEVAVLGVGATGAEAPVADCAVDAEAVEVEVLLDVALDDVVEVNEDDVVAMLFDPDPGFPVNDIISVLDKWI
jgi:hypothetical protein